MEMKDFTGHKFEMLTVIRFSHRIKTNYFWECKCDCGTIKIIRIAALKTGNTKSCGCLNEKMRAARAAIKAPTRLTHGFYKHPLYRRWASIKTRCTNEKCPQYDSYGGRGINICEEWNSNFMAFYNWSMQNGYKKYLQIDRINNDLGYSPENCRWVTISVNGLNKRTNRLLAYQDQMRPLGEWAQIVGKDQKLIWNRLQSGWSIDRALNEPINR